MTIQEFTNVFAELATQLRQSDADEHMLRSYFKAMKDLETPFVLMAADRLAKTTTWFPKTSEWIDMAGVVEQERIAQQQSVIRARLRAGEPPLCGDCDDTGWTHGEKGVAKCACRQMRRLEVIGRRPMPQLQATN